MNAYGVGLGTSPAKVESSTLRMRFGRFELDEANARLTCDGKIVELQPKPFEVLCALARHAGTLVTKNALLDEVWGHRFVSESVLKTMIGKIRSALEDDARNPRYIETVARRGYRFIAADTADAVATPALDRDSPLARQLGELLERATGRKALLLLIDHAHGSERAAELMDYLARWSPEAANDRPHDPSQRRQTEWRPFADDLAANGG